MHGELTGYRDTVRALGVRVCQAGAVVEIAGDARSATYISANGGSQVVDEDTGTLLITETLLGILEDTRAGRYEARFRWVRRKEIQAADDLSKVTDSMDFSLTPGSLELVLSALGPVDVDAFAAPHNAVCERFFSRFDSVGVEGVDVFAQDWSSSVLLILPDFQNIAAMLDHIKRDDAEAALVVPVWSSKPWWWRIWSGTWAARVRTKK